MRPYRSLLAYALAATLSLTACSSEPGQDTSPIEDMDSADASMTTPMVEDMSSQTMNDMSSNNTTSPADMTTTTPPADMSPMLDMSVDMSVDMTADMAPAEDMAIEEDLGDLPQDMTSMEEDMSTELDMTFPSRPAGQCTATADCGDANLTCSRQAVGGICQGPCDACDNIPDAYTYSCVQGSCVRDCASDDDCSLGRYCTGSGRCAIERCVDNVCPTPLFGCTSPDGVCQRFSCDAMTPCPQGTTCTNGVCIEQ